MEILFIILTIGILGMAICSFLLYRNETAFKMQSIICRAIYKYHMEMIRQGNGKGKYLVEYDDMENYDRTLFRFWDWGYKHILPPEKFEIIKPYIEVEKKDG